MQVDFFIVAYKFWSWSKIDSSTRVDFFGHTAVSYYGVFLILFYTFYDWNFNHPIRIQSNSAKIITLLLASQYISTRVFEYEMNTKTNNDIHSISVDLHSLFPDCGICFVSSFCRSSPFRAHALPPSLAVSATLHNTKSNLKMKRNTKLLLHFIMMNKMERTFFYWNEKPHHPNTIDWTVEQLDITRWDSLNSKNTISCCLLEKEKFRLLFFVQFHPFIPFDRFGCLHYSFHRVVCKLVCVCVCAGVRALLRNQQWNYVLLQFSYCNCLFNSFDGQFIKLNPFHHQRRCRRSFSSFNVVRVELVFRLIVFPPTKNILNWAVSRHLSNGTIKFFSSVLQLVEQK